MCPTRPLCHFFPLLFPSFPPPSLSHYHSLLYTSPFSPKDSIWVSVEVGWGGYPSQRSSSFQSHHLWSIVFPTVMRFKGPPYSQRWDTNGAITEASEFSRSLYLRIWLDLFPLVYWLFRLSGCLGLSHHRFGFMNSKQYPFRHKAKHSTLFNY